MSSFVCTVTLEYSSFYVAAQRRILIPFGGENEPFSHTADCINIACRMWQDGATEILFGSPQDFDLTVSPKLDVWLATPTNRVLLFDVNMPEIMSMPVETRRTRVRVWTNHATEPDDIVIVVG